MAPTTTPCSPTSLRERGASLAEYALLVGLISAACLGALRTLGDGTGSRLSSVPAATRAAAAQSGGLGGDGGSDGGGSGGGDSAAEEASQEAKEAEAIEAQASKDETAAALAASVTLGTEDQGSIYWTAKNGKSAKWETTATLANEWDGPVVLAVTITRTYADGHTTVTTRKNIKVPAGDQTDLLFSNNLVNTNTSTKDDVVLVSFQVVEVRGDDPAGEPLTVPGDGSVGDVQAPPFE